MLKTMLAGHTRVRSPTSARGRDVPGSLLGLTSLQGIIENIQVRNHSNVIFVDDSSQDPTI